MNYPANIEQKLGFDQIRQMIKNECISNLGIKLADAVSFSDNFVEINTLLNQTEEFRQILLFSSPFPAQNYFDLTAELHRLKLNGTFIEIQELIDLHLSLETILDCKRYIQPEKEDEIKYYELYKLANKVDIPVEIFKEISNILDDKGNIRDDASEQLRKIRKDLMLKTSSVEKKLNQTIAMARKEGWINEEAGITIRNGRGVIPISATNKRKIKGFVHDTSSTGQTYYIEPEEVFELNNEIRELENEERLEIIHILTVFSNFLRPYISLLQDAYQFLAQMDFIRAKAKFAIKIESYKPILSDKPLIEWFDARHPLLFLLHKIQKKAIVPLNIKLSEKERILIISGPNAGGKSVCLKTVGLLQYMLQCGLLIPLRQTSETGIFKNIFIDIGDEQSIENDLSTYSSHLISMKKLVENANPEMLFLIDEFGSGTEPQLGGAIAESILEIIAEKKAFGVITTHYTNLKLLAGKIDGLVNGAMLYNKDKMLPMYILKTGKPGSSFAFEIAKNIGLQQNILDKARKKTGESHLDFEQQLQQLETDKEEIFRKKQELRVADEFLSEMIQKYQSLHHKLENTKNQIIRQAKEDALELLHQSNRIVENTVRMIKESNADKEVTKEARENISQFKDFIQKQNKSTGKQKPRKSTDNQNKNIETPIFIGDYVRITGQQTIGEVEFIKKDKAVVLANSLRVTLPLSQLQKVTKEELLHHLKKKPKFSNTYSNIMDDINKKAVVFNPKLDIRGKRAEEALVLVKNLIDEAILLSIYEVSILHGKGNGILRKVIREYLQGVEQVKSYKDEHIERGGDGITLVSLQ